MAASQTGLLLVIVQLLVAMVNKLDPDHVTTPLQKVMELTALGIHWKRDHVQKLHVKVSDFYLLRLLYILSACVDPEGCTRGLDPLENHKLHMVSLEILVQISLEKQLDPSGQLLLEGGAYDLL